MKTVNGYWVKPFASGMSCIDTIQGECQRGLSVEQCQELCHQSPYCSAGYHVSLSDPSLASFCLPLNTTIYKNTNFLNNLITPNNATKLSENNGVNVNVFYDEKRYPTKNLAQMPYLFHGDTVFLVQRVENNRLLYLMPDFTFQSDRKNALPLTLGESKTLLFDFDVRINKFSSIHLYAGNSLSSLTFQQGKWSFDPYSSKSHTFRFEGKLPSFIDAGTSFFLRTGEEGYLATDQEQRLQLQATLPLHPFEFELDETNMVNQSVRVPWTFRATEGDQGFKKTMEDFLCLNFPNCRERQSQVWEHPSHRVLCLVFLALGVILWAVIGFFVIRLK